MKIKLDFVTNSSSTSFLFVFRGKELEDLYKAMKNMWSIFELGEGVNVYDLIDYKEHNRNNQIISIDDKIEEIKKEIKYRQDFMKINNKHTHEYDNIQKLESIIEKLKWLKKKGFKNTVELWFEDHNTIGSIISYELDDHDSENLTVIKLGRDG